MTDARNKPKYLMIKERLLEQIEKHRYDTDYLKRPLTENALAAEFGVSRLTARHALKELEREGVVHSVRGVGTLVYPHKLTGQLKTMEQFYNEWAFQSKTIHVDILDLSHHCLPPVTAALRLQIALTDAVVYLERLRSIDNVPIVLDRRYIPLDIGSQITEAQFRDRHLYEVVAETAGIHVERARMEIEATLADETIASKLHIAKKAPLLVRSVTIHDDQQRPIITGWSFYRADLYKYVVEVP